MFYLNSQMADNTPQTGFIKPSCSAVLLYKTFRITVTFNMFSGNKRWCYEKYRPTFFFFFFLHVLELLLFVFSLNFLCCLVFTVMLPCNQQWFHKVALPHKEVNSASKISIFTLHVLHRYNIFIRVAFVTLRQSQATVQMSCIRQSGLCIILFMF